MNRFETLKDIFYQEIEKHCHGIYKQRAYFHSIQVMTLCQTYAKKRHLDIELASIIGLFHDYAQFIHHRSFNHAELSSNMIKQYLDEFSEEEINIITHAIAKHSDKNKIDDAYSELIKDMDLYARYLEDPDYVFTKEEQQRFNQMKEIER